VASSRVYRLSPSIPGFGVAVSGGGDMNGDGLSDFVISAVDFGGSNAGEAYIYLGKPNWFSETATADVTLTAQSSTEAYGWSLSLESDTDGDGLADAVIGAYLAALPELNEGAVHLYLGRTSWKSSPAVLTSPDSTFENPRDEIDGRFGFAVAVGDLDDDGLADVVVGAFANSEPEPGEGNVFLYLGRPQWPTFLETEDVAIDNPNDRVEGFFGYSLALGDANGDGLLDLLVGATTKDEEGEGFLYFGRSDWPPQVVLADTELINPEADGAMGWTASLSSDWNGDGFADPTLGAPDTPDPDGPGGDVFLWFGRQTWPASETTVDVVINNPEQDPSLNTFGRSMD
jgi:hypothetical protein